MNEGDMYEIDVGGLRGSCRVTVLEAEKKPTVQWKPQKFECEAGKEKKIKVPFQIKGTRRGDPKPVLLRNGKPVDLDKLKGTNFQFIFTTQLYSRPNRSRDQRRRC